MISIGDALQQSAAYNRQEANAQAFIKASQEIETSCAACLKGLRPGRKPNGFYVARPETAESCEVIDAEYEVSEETDTSEKETDPETGEAIEPNK